MVERLSLRQQSAGVTDLPTIRIAQLYISPGHNFFGHHGQPPGEHAMLAQRDLFASSQRFNVPGAISESNWSQRLNDPVSAWRGDTSLAAKMDRIRESIRTTGR